MIEETLTLDEWIELNGLERLADQFSSHFKVYGHSQEEIASLVRLCMISLRDEEQRRG